MPKRKTRPAEAEQKRADPTSDAEARRRRTPTPREGDDRRRGRDPASATPDGGGRRAPPSRAAAARRARLSRRCAIPVDRFLAEARRYPRLSERGGARLGMAVRERGDMDAARKLVVHNLRLVVAIAYQYRRAWANILDLFQEGSVGLMEAVKRWEPTLGPRFGTYAAYWIRAFVLQVPADELAPDPRRQHARRAQAVLPPGEGAAEAAGRGVRADAQAAGRQAGRRREGAGRGPPAPRVARGLVRARAPGDGRRGTYPLSERIAARRRVARGRGGAGRDGRRRARSRGRLPRAAHRRARARGLARAPGRRGAGVAGRARASASASPSSGWVRSPTSSRSASAARSSAKLGPDVRTDWLGAESD